MGACLTEWLASSRLRKDTISLTKKERAAYLVSAAAVRGGEIEVKEDPPRAASNLSITWDKIA